MIRLAGIFRNETDQKSGGDAMERAGQRFPGAEGAVPAAVPGGAGWGAAGNDPYREEPDMKREAERKGKDKAGAGEFWHYLGMDILADHR